MEEAESMLIRAKVNVSRAMYKHLCTHTHALTKDIHIGYLCTLTHVITLTWHLIVLTHTHYSYLLTPTYHMHIIHTHLPSLTAHSCTHSLPIAFIQKHRHSHASPQLTCTYKHTTWSQTQVTFWLINLLDTCSQGEAVAWFTLENALLATCCLT